MDKENQAEIERKIHIAKVNKKKHTKSTKKAKWLLKSYPDLKSFHYFTYVQ